MSELLELYREPPGDLAAADSDSAGLGWGLTSASPKTFLKMPVPLAHRLGLEWHQLTLVSNKDNTPILYTVYAQKCTCSYIKIE